MANADIEHRIAKVHRVTKKRKDGTKIATYHYVFRGGPKFWDSNMGFTAADPRYVTAYEAVMRGLRVRPKVDEKSTASVLARYRESSEFQKLKPRTQQDYRHFLDAFEAEFGEDSIALFEEPESLGEIRQWRSKKWGHSAKRYDYAGTVATTFLNWCVNKDAAIKVHFHKGQEKLYKSDRSDMIVSATWTPPSSELPFLRIRPCLGTGMEFLRGGYVGVFPVGWSA